MLSVQKGDICGQHQIYIFINTTDFLALLPLLRQKYTMAASISTVVLYTVFLTRSLNLVSIPGYLNIVRIMHEEQDLSNPLNNWEFKAEINGDSAIPLGTTKAKLPITMEILRLLYRNLDLNIPQLQAFWTACLIAFFAFLQKSTPLPRSAIHIDTQKIVYT